MDHQQAHALAALHAQAFDRPWNKNAFRALLASPGVLALADPALSGFVLVRIVAHEAEILTLAVSPPARRQGFGRRLLDAAEGRAADSGAETLFLEVAEDNAAAVALYAAAGFESAGRRPGYYPRPTGSAADALVLKKPLKKPPA